MSYEALREVLGDKNAARQAAEAARQITARTFAKNPAPPRPVTRTPNDRGASSPPQPGR